MQPSSAHLVNVSIAESEVKRIKRVEESIEFTLYLIVHILLFVLIALGLWVLLTMTPIEEKNLNQDSVKEFKALARSNIKT